MRILIISPELSNLARGNHVTALRWGRILDSLGHEVRFASDFHGQDCDLLVALHAIRSGAAIAGFHAAHPEAPIIVALTGTDIYGLDERFDIDHRDAGWRSMDLATRIVVLQPLAAEEVPELVRDKVVVIFQSLDRQVPDGGAGGTGATGRPDGAGRSGATSRPGRAGRFDACVIGELRDVKDPFRAALASRRLPSQSAVRILHLGAASSEEIARRAGKEEQSNSRYSWLGEVGRDKTLALLRQSRMLIISSRHEGGPNVLTEALALGVPVLATRIPGNEGILGEDYPGYFPVEDTEALRNLLHRAETDVAFYESLRAHCVRRAGLADPARETAAWEALIADVEAGRAPATEQRDS